MLQSVDLVLTLKLLKLLNVFTHKSSFIAFKILEQKLLHVTIAIKISVLNKTQDVHKKT